MKLAKVKAEFRWMTPNPLLQIESAARTCYKSEEHLGLNTERFIRMLIKRDHRAMLEHASMSYKLICDRGISHAIVRHRLFSFAQESTQYCNYHGKEMEFIPPLRLEQFSLATQAKLETHLAMSAVLYSEMIEDGCRPDEARDVLPTCLKTELIITGNFQQWRYAFGLRLDKPGDQDKFKLALSLIREDARSRVPIIFDEEV